VATLRGLPIGAGGPPTTNRLCYTQRMKIPQTKIGKFAHKLEKLAELKPTVTDLEVSLHTGVSLRSTQRYIATLKQSGLVEVENKRHLHYAFGWCNERTIKFTRSY
jgi:transcription initiation factor IIE alpha subunit